MWFDGNGNTEQECQSNGGVATHKHSAVRTDDAGEAVKADQYAGIAAHGVKQIHQCQRRPVHHSDRWPVVSHGTRVMLSRTLCSRPKTWDQGQTKKKIKANTKDIRKPLPQRQ